MKSKHSTSRFGFKEDLTWKIGCRSLKAAMTTKQRTAVIELTILAVRRDHPHLRISDLTITEHLIRSSRATRLSNPISMNTS